MAEVVRGPGGEAGEPAGRAVQRPAERFVVGTELQQLGDHGQFGAGGAEDESAAAGPFQPLLAAVGGGELADQRGVDAQRAVAAEGRGRGGEPTGGLGEVGAAEEVGEADGPGVGGGLAQRGLGGVGRPRVGQQARGEDLGAAVAAHPAPELLVGDGDAEGAAEHLADGLVVGAARDHAPVPPLVGGGGADREPGREGEVELAGEPLRAPAELVEYPGQFLVAPALQIGHGSDGSGPPGAVVGGSPKPVAARSCTGRRTGRAPVRRRRTGPEAPKPRDPDCAAGTPKAAPRFRETAFDSCGATGN